LARQASEKVGLPRIGESPASFECKFMQEIRAGGFSLILGRIAMLHIGDTPSTDDFTRLD
jgi:flavin reductase (DIM6/NTAB) family NADH-FMN oxidoreductase RutF